MTSNSQPIKVGFVGLSTTGGWASLALAPALLDSSLEAKYNLVAICTTSQASAEATSAKYSSLTKRPVKAYYGPSGLASLANDPEVDLVAVSVRAWRHKEVVMALIEGGKDLFVEWPVGRNLDETREIAEAVKRKGVKMIVGLQGRMSKIAIKVKEIIASGAIGKVQYTTYNAMMGTELGYWGPFPKADTKDTLFIENGVRPITTAGGHLMDTFTHILGDFTSVTATASRIHETHTLIDNNGNPTGETLPSEMSDHYTFSGRLVGGAHATIMIRAGVKTTPGHKTLQWEIEGSEGLIRMESDFVLGGVLGGANPVVYLNGERIDIEGAPVGPDPISPLVAMWDAYTQGEKGGYATLDDAIRIKKLTEAVERSAVEGRTVRL
ncbi:hypothetical protein CVT24_002627 [Panaeolus cyanescens]|uniref:Uncharacterized protein n=1 Tax=Panaeolus cyanescens TaxID=181874 RepID=A0A409YU52_9AGAR|nr:hypothetical protein CVT24_002627 [Panaeolus cyanescens]